MADVFPVGGLKVYLRYHTRLAGITRYQATLHDTSFIGIKSRFGKVI